MPGICMFVLDNEGVICIHKNIGANPEALLKLIRPYQHDMVLGVECMFTWYWVADFCAEQGIEFVLGYALMPDWFCKSVRSVLYNQALPKTRNVSDGMYIPSRPVIDRRLEAGRE